MASKKFKGKACTYCEKGIANTGDHVIPRALFPKDLRDNIPKVPACADCNNRKSELETELSAVLPFGGRHERAAELLKSVGRRLTKNQALLRKINEEWALRVDETGISPRTVPMNTDVIEEFLRFVVRGLSVHHWNERVAHVDEVEVSLVYPEVDSAMKAAQAIGVDQLSNDVGRSTLRYSVSRAAQGAKFRLWRLELLGGALMAGDGPETASAWWAVSGNRDVVIDFRKHYRDA